MIALGASAADTARGNNTQAYLLVPVVVYGGLWGRAAGLVVVLLVGVLGDVHTGPAGLGPL